VVHREVTLPKMLIQINDKNPNIEMDRALQQHFMIPRNPVCTMYFGRKL